MFGIASFKSKKPEGVCEERSHDAWYHGALADCADGIWDWDLLKGQFHISSKLQDLIGYTHKETQERSYAWWAEQIHPEDHAEIHRKMEEISHSKSEFVYFDTIRFLCKNGDYIWLENHAKILRNQKDEIIRMVGITINITPQKFIQNQLRSVIFEQEKEAQGKIRFLSALSHEFRSPLGGIIGMATLLKETKLSDEQLHYAESITNSTEMLLTLVNDILDVSKLNSGKFEFESIRFSPNQVLQRASDLIRPSLIKKNITFNIFMDTPLPDFLIGDPTRLQQILVNLLSNAAKFTSKGSITLRINEQPSSKAQDPHILHFEISDTGIGIAPEVQDSLFEDFTQANSSITRMYGGTGLGLSICKELVHLMGGQIGVKSELGKGSTFWFTVPFEKTDLTSSLESPAADPIPNHPKQSKLNVLLAEDNQVNQEVMHGLLSLLGDEVTLANNGEEAIDLFQTKKFDIILMDLNMPILDGLSATKTIRTLPNGNIPIIAVTANLFTENQENCREYGITHVLHKPINKTILEETLRPYRSQIKSIPGEIAEPQKQEAPSRLAETSFDKNTLTILVNDLGKEKVIKLLDIYRNDALVLVTQIKNSSPQEATNYAHTLAGMSENLGIYGVGRTARNIMNASQNTPETLPILIKDLERHFERSLAEIQDLAL
jgi:PAS domain S-box-containing protein